jgi:hypothetical protein
MPSASPPTPQLYCDTFEALPPHAFREYKALLEQFVDDASAQHDRREAVRIHVAHGDEATPTPSADCAPTQSVLECRATVQRDLDKKESLDTILHEFQRAAYRTQLRCSLETLSAGDGGGGDSSAEGGILECDEWSIEDVEKGLEAVAARFHSDAGSSTVSLHAQYRALFEHAQKVLLSQMAELKHQEEQTQVSSSSNSNTRCDPSTLERLYRRLTQETDTYPDRGVILGHFNTEGEHTTRRL